MGVVNRSQLAELFKPGVKAWLKENPDLVDKIGTEIIEYYHPERKGQIILSEETLINLPLENYNPPGGSTIIDNESQIQDLKIEDKKSINN